MKAKYVKEMCERGFLVNLLVFSFSRWYLATSL